MKKRFEGQIVIITGGARGIGEGICEVFCKEGATVALWDVLDGQEIVDRISANGGQIFYQKVDVTNQESVDAAVTIIINTYGILSIKHKLQGWCPSMYSIKKAEIIETKLNTKITFK